MQTGYRGRCWKDHCPQHRPIHVCDLGQSFACLKMYILGHYGTQRSEQTRIGIQPLNKTHSNKQAFLSQNQPLCSSRVTQSQLRRTTSRRLLSISKMEDSTTLTVKKCFLMCSWSPLCFHVCPLPLVLSMSATEKGLVVFFTPSLQTSVYIEEIPLEHSLLQRKRSQLSAFPHRRVAPVPSSSS